MHLFKHMKALLCALSLGTFTAIATMTPVVADSVL